MSVWHDESKGLVNGRKIDDPIDLTSESENEDGDEQEPKNAEDTQVSDRPHSSPPPIPPSSASEYNSMTEDDDVDMDALIREDEERLTSSADMTTNHRNDTFHGVPDVTDEDEAMWAQLDADFDDLTTPSLQATSKPFVPPPPPAEDEDMWDIVREMEMEEVTNNAKTTRSAHPPPEESMTPVAEMRGTTPVRKATNDEGWDEMYAEIDPE